MSVIIFISTEKPGFIISPGSNTLTSTGKVTVSPLVVFSTSATAAILVTFPGTSIVLEPVYLTIASKSRRKSAE